MKIYIAGPITINKDNYKEPFLEAEKYLRELGWEVFNPASDEYDEPVPGMDKWDKKAWLYYMHRDIELVSMCDAVYFLKGWEESPGANIEHIVATKFNLARYYQGGDSIIPAKEKK